MTPGTLIELGEIAERLRRSPSEVRGRLKRVGLEVCPKSPGEWYSRRDVEAWISKPLAPGPKPGPLRGMVTLRQIVKRRGLRVSKIESTRQALKRDGVQPREKGRPGKAALFDADEIEAWIARVDGGKKPEPEPERVSHKAKPAEYAGTLAALEATLDQERAAWMKLKASLENALEVEAANRKTVARLSAEVEKARAKVDLTASAVEALKALG